MFQRVGESMTGSNEDFRLLVGFNTIYPYILDSDKGKTLHKNL